MPGEIKPIETRYNGYKFRSRLEARWAVFFDAAGIRYEYEPEGFKTKNGLCYLPDFYLPDENMYVEVKAPRHEQWEDLFKALKFVGEAIKCLMILTNIPSGETPIVLFPIVYYNPVNEDLMVRHCPFVYGVDGQWVSLDRRCPDPEPRKEKSLWLDDWYFAQKNNDPVEIEKYELATTPLGDTEEDNLMYYYYSGTSKKYSTIICNYFKKARQARFEFGKKG